MENVSDRAQRAGHGILLGHSKWVSLVALLGLLLAFFGAPREAQAAGYAVNFGGSATGVGSYLVSSTAADSAGNSYITGSFDALSTIIGGVTLNALGLNAPGSDLFVAKLDPSGTVLWAKNFGGLGAMVYARGIVVDTSGNVYVGGYFGTANMNTPALTLTYGSTSDAFVIKLDALGNLAWAKNFGGASVSTQAWGIALDGSGNVVLGGHFSGGNLTNPSLTKIGTKDGFLIKVSPSGTTLWAKNYGGSGATITGTAVAADNEDNAYLVGNLDASLTTPSVTKIGSNDAFAIKVVSSTGATAWAKNYGGSALTTRAFGVAVDASRNVYLTGEFGGHLTTPSITSTGSRDAFAFKLDSSGNTTWAKNFGGVGGTLWGDGIAVDASGNVYVGGTSNSSTSAFTRIGTGATTYDSFAYKLDASGNTTWAKNFGGSGATFPDNPQNAAGGVSIGVDGSGNVVLGSNFSGASLTTPSVTRVGIRDAFVVKLLAADGATSWNRSFNTQGPTAQVTVSSIVLDASNNAYIAGYLGDSASQTGTPFTFGSVTLTLIGTRDAFVAKLDPTGTVLWAKNFGGAGANVMVDPQQGALALDGTSALYVAGRFSGANLTTPVLTMTGTSAGFVFKLDPTSGNDTWTKTFGGTGVTAQYNMVGVDSGGNVYWSASLKGNLTVPLSVVTGIPTNNTATVLVKLDSTGNPLWGRAYGSSTGSNLNMSPECMAVTPTGDVHIGGYQQGALNQLNKPGLTLAKMGSMDGFLLKVDTNSSTVWGTNFGGATAQTSFGECAIAVDGSGNVFFGSDFASGNLTQPALTKIGTRDAFLVKLTVSDGTVSWSKNYGGASASMFNTGLTLDGSGNIYLGGSFQTADLTTPPITRFGAGDPYMLQLDASGTVSSTAHYGGQGATTSGKGIALDSTGNFVVAGTMAMANLTTPWLTRKGRTSSFVLREPLPTQSAPALAGIAAGWPTGTAVTVSATSNIDATAFWVALPAGAPAPTGAQIVAGLDASGNPVSLKSLNPMTGGVPTAITVSGLTTSTSYRVYFATYNGTASSPLYVDVTTTSGEPPTTPILAGLTAGTPDATSVTLSSTSDVAATCHWIALPAGSSTPSAVQILQGQDASGTPVSLQGSASMPAGVPTSLSVSGLAATTNYRVYVVAYNGSLGTPLSVDVTTSGGTPSVTTNAASNVTISGATLNASVSPNGVAVTGIGFEYGPTTAYGTSAAATPASLGAGAGTTGASYPVTGLSCGTTFHYRTVIAYGSSETAHGSDQSFATSACGPVLAGLTAGTPTATSVTLSSTSNLLGTGYWVALPTASSAPSGAQIAAGQDSTGASVLLNGSGAMTANVPASIAVTGLSSSTSYRIYFVASNGTVGSPLYVDVTSSAAPTPVLAGLTAGTPTGTSVTLSSTSNVTATGYWVALPTGSSTPSGAQIVAGQDSTGASVSLKGSGSMTANVPASIAVTGLSSSTSYRIYFVASNGTVGSPLYVDVTSAAPTPVLAGLTAGTPAATSVTLSSTSNVTATGYWVALPTGSTAPSGAQIVAGQDSTGTPVSLKGSGSMTANAAASIAVTGLSSSTSYRIYFVASNGTVGSSLYVDVTTSGGQSQCAVDTECGSGNYCDGGQCYPIGEAASIQVTSGSGQTAVVGLPFSGALTVLVSDSGGHPVSGVTVQFTAPSSGASATLSTTTAVTDTSGVASDFALANTVAGTYSVVASIKAGTVQATITLTNRAGAANQVQPSVSSTTQRIPVGSSVPTPLVVTVRDANGNPVAGVEVTFSVSSTGPGATLGALKVLTDANGTATITATANTLTGSYVVYAQIAGVATPGRFELTNTAGPVAQLTVSPGSSNQSAQVGTAFTNRLGLTVVDAYGNGVSGLTVTFAAPSTGASAVLNPATPTTTNAAGVASVAATANGTVGDYVVTAAAQGLSTTFNLSNLIGAPGAITASASSTPQSATVGTAFTFPLLVTVVDSFGHPVSGALVIFAPPSGVVTAVLSSLTTTTNGTGLASVSATASLYGGSYTTTASVAGVAAPARFALTNVPRPTTTSLEVTPTALKVGEVATATVTVLAVVGQPSGVVRLLEGTQELGQATLASGTATVSLTATQALLGTHTVFVRYDGEGPNSPSESASVTVTVTEAASGDAGVDAATQDSGGDAATVDAADSAVFDSGDAGAVDGSTVRDAAVDAAVDAAMADGSRVQDSASGTDAGSSDPGASGGGCQTGRGSARWPASLSLLLGFALLLRRRRHG